ncbi:CRISPR system precrRNA processing endoribonuclease RAMP protein Cas6 [Thiofilum flexile]|uniref:CRISPR system precrRNA processing endoribonuclease RAMP protein Cas6 n=1 Tax=Thiofilum flexile TaxID=125627 RepID=UPI00036A6DEA|nr:CRISPR system precrRNA processing endoribonuclease RAMP protein Cas6 [Thiofilum flexile]
MTETSLDVALDSLLPLRGAVVTLACTTSARMSFFHQPALSAFLRFLAGSPEGYEHLIRIDAPESGRVRYHKGDYYRFLLLGLAGSERLLDRLLQQLALLPASAPKPKDGLAFGANWRLVSVQDMFSGEPVCALEQLSVYERESLEREAELWGDCRQLDWQWVAPARVLKDKATRGQADADRFVRDQVDLEGSLLPLRVWHGLAALLRARGVVTAPVLETPPVVLVEAHLFWLDVQYRGRSGAAKDMGGVSGRVRLALPQGLPLFWWQLLVLGQYLGVGQRTSFGWGRYVLKDSEGAQSIRRVFPAQSLLVLAQEEDNLTRAWRYVLAGRDIPAEWADTAVNDLEDIAPLLQELCPVERLQDRLEQMLWGQYQVPALCGYLIPKTKGDGWCLALPPLFDRVLQRAVQQVLVEALEPLMADFRTGGACITTSQALEAAWREGFCWRYEGDVRDLFDSVKRERLAECLRAIFYGDPVVEAVLGWLAASVRKPRVQPLS